jgi:DNA-binding transcriptional regulator YiaG
MPNIAVALKAEIARVARKEIRSEVASLTKATTQYRKQVSALRKQIAMLEAVQRRQARGGRPEVMAEEGEATGTHRFSPKGLANNRKRLGLSAAAMAQLLGCSALSVYKWESGKTRPRPKQIEAIAAIRTLGRKEAQTRLEASAQPTKRRGRSAKAA